MAKTLSKLIIVLFTIFFSSALVSTSQPDESYYKTLSPSKLGLKKEKLVQIHFYLHRVVSGPNQTEVVVVTPTNVTDPNSPFGLLAVYDYLLTDGRELSSKPLGKAEGILAIVSKTEGTPFLAMTILFTQGKYNGSTLSVLGLNPFLTQPLRELPIVGGTGLFRFARGYIETTTIFTSATAVEGIFEYNLYVYQYY